MRIQCGNIALYLHIAVVVLSCRFIASKFLTKTMSKQLTQMPASSVQIPMWFLCSIDSGGGDMQFTRICPFNTQRTLEVNDSFEIQSMHCSDCAWRQAKIEGPLPVLYCLALLRFGISRDHNYATAVTLIAFSELLQDRKSVV